MYLGPVTWMRWRGKWCSKGKYLHCCDPIASVPSDDCLRVPLTKARATVISQLTAAFGKRASLWNGTSTEATAGASTSVAQPAGIDAAPTATMPRRGGVTLLEFHWPDSGLGRWGEPHTFLQMLPRMRPTSLPGCRVVVTTLLRDPVALYPSLQLHQFPAMRGYAPPSWNLSACDYATFVAAFPNFQGWRLTSPEWSPMPLWRIGHAAMYKAGSRLLRKLDVVGVTERMEEWLDAVCARAGIYPCPALKHLNQDRRSCACPRACRRPFSPILARHTCVQSLPLHCSLCISFYLPAAATSSASLVFDGRREGRHSTTQCPPVDPVHMRYTVQLHALADQRLHTLAVQLLEAELKQLSRAPLALRHTGASPRRPTLARERAEATLSVVA